MRKPSFGCWNTWVLPTYSAFSWAELLRRVWSIDVLACQTCGGRVHLVATIEHPAVVWRILSHLGLPTKVPQPLPARAPPETPRQSVFPEY